MPLDKVQIEEIKLDGVVVMYHRHFFFYPQSWSMGGAELVT